jgi:molybdenum-dependent DNA-binding transcriptional regulator ModE
MHMHIESWDDIRVALAVARTGTVSGAAAELGVHHATVIRRIDALETALRARLFQRHTRGYALTEAGRTLLAAAGAADERFSQMATQKMGGMQSVMGMMPGMAKMAKQAESAGYDDKVVRHQVALINSMTKKERANPDLLQASRKKRIAAGAGMEVSDLNKLLKMQKQMADTMKKLGKMGKGGMMKQAMRAMTGKGGGLPDMDNLDPAKMAEAQKMLSDPKGLGGQLGRAGLPGGLGGLFGKK